MREIPLTKGAVALVDDEDYDRIAATRWYLTGAGYACRLHSQLMHRVIASAPAGLHVDHINHDKLDNRRANLRVCTPSENGRNRPPRPGASRFKGVYRVRVASTASRWKAEARAGGEYHYFGTFATEEDAARAYDAGVLRLSRAAFEFLNFPEHSAA